MGLPLPKVVADVGPGGGLVTAMNGMNALAHNMLKRKYYAPDIESQINNRNALTEGQNITNQYLPDKLRLANAMAELHNQYYAPNIQSEINNRNALTEQYNQKNKLGEENPFLTQPGTAGEIARLLYLQKHGIPVQDNNSADNEDNSNIPSINKNNPIDYQKLIQQQLAHAGTNKNKIISPEARFAQDYADVKEGFVPGTDRMQKFSSQESANKALELMDRKEKQLSWKSMPANAKMNVLAYANGAGIDIDEASRELAKGTSLEELYVKHGFDPKNPPEPDFLATTGNVTKLKDRQAALKEMQVISKFVKEGLGPYSRTILGYSPSQIKGALSTKNDEQQAKFLAARGLVPELTGLRLMAANAKATVHAIKSMQDKSLMNIKIYESMVTPKVWKRSQELMDQVLNKGMKKSSESYTHHKNIGNNTEKTGKKVKAHLRWNREKQDFEEIK
jgi:hypothetical protein